MSYAPHKLSMERVEEPAFTPEDRIGALELQNLNVGDNRALLLHHLDAMRAPRRRESGAEHRGAARGGRGVASGGAGRRRRTGRQAPALAGGPATFPRRGERPPLGDEARSWRRTCPLP